MPDIDVSKVLRLLLVSQFLTGTSRGVFYTVGAIYFVDFIHLSIRQIGVGFTVAGGAGVLAAYAAGHLADRIDPGSLLTFTLGAEGLGMLAFANGQTLLEFMITASIVSATNRGGGTIIHVLIAQHTSGAGGARARAKSRVAINAGVGGGSAVAAAALWVGTAGTLRGALIAAGCASIVAAWSDRALRHVPTRAHNVESQSSVQGAPSDVWHDWRYLGLGFAHLLWFTSMSLLTVALPVWISTRTNAVSIAPGLVLITNTVLVVALQTRLAGDGESTSRTARGLWWAGVLTASSCSLFAFTDAAIPAATLAVLLAGAATFSISEILWTNYIFTLSINLARRDSIGRYLGVMSTAQAIGLMAGPVVVTSALRMGGRGWIMLGGSYLAAAGIGWLSVRRARYERAS